MPYIKTDLPYRTADAFFHLCPVAGNKPTKNENMKTRYLFLIFPALLLVLATACSSPDTDDPGEEDDSPGVDEYFHMTLDGSEWEVNEDSHCGGVVMNFGGGPKVGLTATRMSDSTHIGYYVPYFYGTDTTFTMPPQITLQYQGSDDVYLPVDGTFSISRSTVNSMEVYEGNFAFTYEGMIYNETIQVTGGAFRIARLL
jgi:hypothetical protein